MNRTTKKVVVIDDNVSNNYVFKVILRHLCKPALPDVTDFVFPKDGVDYLTRVLLQGSEPIILFLDINMPVLSGWDVLDELNKLPGYAKKNLTVYIFSSSIDPRDEKKALTYALVERFVRKPLMTSMYWLKELLTEDMAV